MAQENYQGPYYRYNVPLLRNTLSVAQSSAENFGFVLKYAIKANNESRILKEIKSFGLGIDCVSQEEIAHAIEHGWRPEEIVFAGSGKTIRELRYALQQQIQVIHCESYEEWEIIRELKKEIPSTTQVALRLNPDLKVDTHEKISTGEKHHKFGMSFADALTIINQDSTIIGFHIHVGSQVLDMVYFEDLSLLVRSFIEQLPSNFTLRYLNLGGGLGISYENPERYPIPDFDGWMRALRTHLPEEVIETIHLEPGRSIVGQCGTLIGEVQYIKHRDTRPTAILDVGMTELLRPALYGARHKVSVNNDQLITTNYTVSGPTCESSDKFGENYVLPTLSPGDLVTIHSVGAYGSSMRLSYNLRKPLNSVFIEEVVSTAFRPGIKKYLVA